MKTKIWKFVFQIRNFSKDIDSECLEFDCRQAVDVNAMRNCHSKEVGQTITSWTFDKARRIQNESQHHNKQGWKQIRSINKSWRKRNLCFKMLCFGPAHYPSPEFFSVHYVSLHITNIWNYEMNGTDLKKRCQNQTSQFTNSALNCIPTTKS